MRNPADTTQIDLLYSNRNQEDILLRDLLDRLAAAHPQLRVSYTLTGHSLSLADNIAAAMAINSSEVHLSPESTPWSGFMGRIDHNMIAEVLPAPAEDTLILVCGSKSFVDTMSGRKTPDKQQGELTGLLKAAGYTESMVYKF